jgi:hypothetical protein
MVKGTKTWTPAPPGTYGVIVRTPAGRKIMEKRNAFLDALPKAPRRKEKARHLLPVPGLS